MHRAPPSQASDPSVARARSGSDHVAPRDRPGTRPPSGPHSEPPEKRRRIPRVWLLGGGGTLFLLVVIALFAFGPIVRSRVAKEGEARRLDVTIGSVRPGFFAVGLRDVRVRLKGVEGVEVRLDEVRVDLSAGLSVRDVAAHGGEIRLEGEPEELVERLRTFQRNGKTGAAPEKEKARHTPMSADGLTLAWKLGTEGDVSGSAMKVSRNDEAIRLGASRVAATYKRATVEVLDVDIELAPDGVARRVSATAVTVGQEPSKTAAIAAKPSASAAVDPVPPPLPPATQGGKTRGGKPVALKGKTPAAQPAVVKNDEPVLPLPDLHALRTRINVLATTLGGRIPDGSKVDLAGLSVKLDIGGEPFAFGPGPFTMERHGDMVRLSFASDKAGTAGSTPLSIDAELPLGAGDVTARMSGGPVSLAMLGVKEGTKGLFDVAKGTVSGKGQVVLSAAGDAVTFDGQIALRTLSIKQPRLSAEPLRGIDLAIMARGVLDDAGKLRVDDANLDMGALHVRTHGTIEETKDHFGLALSVDIAPAGCQALLDSTPQGLLPTVRAARMTGTFGATSRVAFDTRTIDKLVLDYQVDDRCKMSEVPRDLSKDRFSSAFTYRTYHADGTPSETSTGPGSSSWTDLDNISPFMVAAVLTTEDGAFYRHHGFNHSAIRNSTAANLKAKRFVRGASTITMQLAKNLFLSREKTLSRKIEEVILTDYLEQAFRKDDMMELYLNVIEFGPDVYGVTRAAEYYFGRRPEELDLPECFFLASIMPSPVRYGRIRDKGQVSEGWMRHVQALMEIAGKNGKVSRAELTEGLARPIVFFKPGDPRPEPRKPVSAGRRDPYEQDSGWQPLD